MILDKLDDIMDLDDSEREEFRDNYFQYEDEIMELVKLYQKNQEMSEKKIRLHSQLARINFDIYETWMELHKNAITLSSYRAEINLRSIDIEKSLMKKLDEIIEKYVLIEKFA